MPEAPRNFIRVGGVLANAANVSMPARRNLRNAWQLDGDVITIDMDKAKEIRARALIERRTLAAMEEKERLIGHEAVGRSRMAQASQERIQRLEAAVNYARIRQARSVAELDVLTEDDV